MTYLRGLRITHGMDTLSEDDGLDADLAAIRPAQDDAYARILEATVRSAL